MKIYFLGADVPLTKVFSPAGKDAYPLVSNVTSYEEDITTAKEFYEAISSHAAQGRCLLKGELSRPLTKESRRNTTKTDEHTSWICLDFDRHECADIDTELRHMKLGDVSYVLQYSASHGLDENTGTMSAHVFMLLEGPLPAPTLKAWLMDMNLTLFRDDLRLSRTKSVLSWPLDITTCQNDKLLYIAPPRFLKPLKDPLKVRIQLVPKKLQAVPLDRIGEKHINALKQDERKVLNELRKAEGLPTRTAKTSWVGSVEVLNKPDVATVTGEKDCGDFIRLNLNGGDSWAYWHPKDNFELIHSFKEDVWYKTKELVPGYYQSLVDKQMALNATPTENGDLILAFRDMKTADYYNGLWNPTLKKLDLYRAKNETQLDHWMRSHGRVLGEFIPIWDILYNPREEWTVDDEFHRINTFVPSKYMHAEGVDHKPMEAFPTIYKIIKHMLGEPASKHELSNHFLNWFACVMQRKHKPLTAWVMHGVEGCLAGETEITFRRGKRTAGRPISIKEAYEKWNGVYPLGPGKGKAWDLSLQTYAHSVRDDFTIGYHEVYRIVESGVKMLYRVLTDDGELIRVSYEHPFMRPDGSFTKLCDLKPGDVILKRGEKNQHVLFAKGRSKQRKTIHSIQHHPHAWQHIIAGKNYKRSHKARLVWEAAMNGLSLDEFVHILRHDPKSAMMMKYLDPSIIVHHKDEDCTNDELDNLEIIDKLNHDQHHAETTGLGTVLTRKARILMITPDKEEMTYDMTMKAPYHNYVANGFCVSNTGKGYFFNKIATPLLGKRNTISVMVSNIEDQFNDWMEGKLLTLIDEVDVDDFREKGRVTARLRGYITEPTMPLRRMRTSVIDVPNYNSLIFSSNRPQPVAIPASDRRYNVGDFQPAKLPKPSDTKVTAELEKFAEWLLAHKADTDQADTVLETDARAKIARLSLTSTVETCQAIVNGDFEQLWLARPDEKLMNEMGVSNAHTQNAAAYIMVLKEIARTWDDKLTRDELFILLQYNVGDGIPRSPNKFTSLLRHNGIETGRIRKNDVVTYGIEVKWKVSPELRAELEATLTTKKPTLRKVK